MMTSFDTNKDKVYLLFKDNIGRSCIRSRARLHDYKPRDYGITNSKFFDNLVAKLVLSIEVSDPAILLKLWIKYE